MIDENVCPFLGFLTLLFVVLKLTGLITWSWLWVVSPLLIPFGFGLVVSSFVLILLLIAIIVK